MSDGDGHATCPSCGGAGGGPFGRPGSAWDTEAYVCPRCRGLGTLRATAPTEHRLAKAPAERAATLVPAAKPGIAGTRPGVAKRGKRRSSSGA
jgi:hypothetical protein